MLIFQYHNREVSYSSLLDLSITARQRSLYDKHGLDIEHWTEMGGSPLPSKCSQLYKSANGFLVAEAKTLRKEIKRIAADYDLEWQGELENLSNLDKFPLNDPRRKEDTPESGLKIDIDKTINEASELAEQTKERAEKAKEAERKGKVLDERSEDGKKSKKIGEEDKEGAKRGKEKARKIIEKQG